MNSLKVIDIIRSLAPEQYQADWDNSRIQVCGTRDEVKKIAVTLDPLPSVVKECLDWGADLVLTHHPLFLKPMAPTEPGQYLDVLRLLVPGGVWMYSAHTSLDCRPEGPAFWLGSALGLTNTSVIEPVRSFPAREVFFQAPARITEREARPMAETPGVLAVSQSAAGEVRVMCEEHAWKEIDELLIAAFGKRPEYFVRRLEAPAITVGYGQIGELPLAMTYEGFAKLLEKTLFSVQKPFATTGEAKVKGVAWAECGPRTDSICRVAYTTGSGASLIPAAFAAGADVFICGDVKHHPAQETPGLVFDVGHFILEEEMMRLFAQEAQSALKEAGGGVEARFFAGRNPFSHRVLA